MIDLFCSHAPRHGLVLTFIALLGTVARAATGTGTIEGRVLNSSTGNFLGSARVAVEGTAIASLTNANGEYRLTGVPAGPASVVVSVVGLAPRTQSVTVSAGGVVAQDFDLGVAGEPGAGRTVVLDTVSVTARALSAQAVALTEQRNAPNIKAVISPDEFVDQAEGNIGEFIKYVPGLDLQYNPFSPQFVTIRGMPASGTLVQFDGMPTAPAPAGNSRSFDMNTAANANIDRVEISKVPTPDMPANAVGGSINVISKSGFSRRTPLLSYNSYLTYNASEDEFSPSLSKVAGPDGLASKRPVQLAYDLSYIFPWRKNLAFTFALTRAPRFNEIEYRSPTWNTVTGLLNAYQFNELVSDVDIRTGKATIDWKPGPDTTVQVSYYKMDRRSLTRQHFQVLTPGAGSTGDWRFIQGAATGVGTAAQNLSGNQQYRSLELASARVRHDGPVWKVDGFASLSNGGFTIKDLDDGFFGTVAANQTGLVIRADNLDNITRRGIPGITATRGGQAVDIFNGAGQTINTVTSAASVVDNTVTSFGANLARDVALGVPVRVKLGAYSEMMERDNKGGTLTWTFAPPGGAAGRLASAHNVINDAFSRRAPLTEIGGRAVFSRYLSLAKIADLYRANPAWFVLNEAAAHTNRVNASIRLKESITAFYGRADAKFFENKLWLVAGARYERTDDEGRGPLNDIGATYQRGANGALLRNAAGQLVRIPGNALTIAQAQYTERGARKKTSYGDLYPSLNASYNFTDRIVARAGYARTIGRPDLTQIIPSIIVTDPSLDVSTHRITVVDGSLKPWTADNFDLTLEVYDLKGATASVSLFQKNIRDFFVDAERPVTPADLTDLGLPNDYADYFIRRTRNGRDAELSGVELSWRQQLSFVPVIGRRLQAFANLTSLAIDGTNVADFAEFSPRNFNAGIGYATPAFAVKLNVHNNKWVRRAPLAAGGNNRPDSFTFRAPSTRWDFSAELRVWRRLSVYYSVRNLTAEPVRLEIRSPGLPAYLRPRNYQFVAANHTLGLKGTF
ncbi:MAG: TonB-dependent receptor [Opitutaceae bacterium]|nr:TonB-dependent receptor [Opitutaceae bacterium]